MPNIDWDLISRLEGGCHTRGYVPPDPKGRSGVTIGTGFDLGRHAPRELAALDLPTAVWEKLRPYAGITGRPAERFLARNPLVLSEDEADLVDASVRRSKLRTIASLFEDNADIRFETLPDGLATVYCSVAFHYGPDLPRATPRFFSFIADEDWAAAYLELRDFGDVFPTRRNREADYLQHRMREAGIEIPTAIA